MCVPVKVEEGLVRSKQWVKSYSYQGRLDSKAVTHKIYLSAHLLHVLDALQSCLVCSSVDVE